MSEKLFEIFGITFTVALACYLRLLCLNPSRIFPTEKGLK